MKLNRKFVEQAFRETVRFVERQSPTILTGLAAAGVVTTVIMAVRATPKAMAILEEEKLGRAYAGKSEKLKATEVVGKCWKCYVPTACMAGLTIACAIGANSINFQRNAALSSLYSVSSAALKEYEDKVVETVGEDKNAEIKQAIAKDRIAAAPAQNDISLVESDDVIIYDCFSGRKFKSTINKIQAAVNEINYDITMSSDWKSLNEFYGEIGLDEIKPGDAMGFGTDNLLELDFSGQLDDNGRPIVAMDYKIMPKPKYWGEY